jgi:hypothetical protein
VLRIRTAPVNCQLYLLKGSSAFRYQLITDHELLFVYCVPNVSAETLFSPEYTADVVIDGLSSCSLFDMVFGEGRKVDFIGKGGIEPFLVVSQFKHQVVGQPHIGKVLLYALSTALALKLSFFYALDGLSVVVAPVEGLLDELTNVQLSALTLPLVTHSQTLEAVYCELSLSAAATQALQDAFSSQQLTWEGIVSHFLARIPLTKWCHGGAAGLAGRL